MPKNLNFLPQNIFLIETSTKIIGKKSKFARWQAPKFLKERNFKTGPRCRGINYTILNTEAKIPKQDGPKKVF